MFNTKEYTSTITVQRDELSLTAGIHYNNFGFWNATTNLGYEIDVNGCVCQQTGTSKYTCFGMSMSIIQSDEIWPLHEIYYNFENTGYKINLQDLTVMMKLYGNKKMPFVSEWDHQEESSKIDFSKYDSVDCTDDHYTNMSAGFHQEDYSFGFWNNKSNLGYEFSQSDFLPFPLPYEENCGHSLYINQSHELMPLHQIFYSFENTHYTIDLLNLTIKVRTCGEDKKYLYND